MGALLYQVQEATVQEFMWKHGLVSQVTQWYKNPLTMQELQETWVQSVCWEDPLEEKTATNSSILLLLLHLLGDTITRLTVSSHFGYGDSLHLPFPHIQPTKYKENTRHVQIVFSSEIRKSHFRLNGLFFLVIGMHARS